MKQPPTKAMSPSPDFPWGLYIGWARTRPGVGGAFVKITGEFAAGTASLAMAREAIRGQS
ncbi:MAG TPA: hypothetical protein VEI99_01265 [Terriglobales bacterium]|nr:hypothetical protein [Terriglobales bacterium]